MSYGCFFFVYLKPNRYFAPDFYKACLKFFLTQFKIQPQIHQNSFPCRFSLYLLVHKDEYAKLIFTQNESQEKIF